MNSKDLHPQVFPNQLIASRTLNFFKIPLNCPPICKALYTPPYHLHFNRLRHLLMYIIWILADREETDNLVKYCNWLASFLDEST